MMYRLINGTYEVTTYSYSKITVNILQVKRTHVRVVVLTVMADTHCYCYGLCLPHVLQVSPMLQFETLYSLMSYIASNIPEMMSAGCWEGIRLPEVARRRSLQLSW